MLRSGPVFEDLETHLGGTLGVHAVPLEPRSDPLSYRADEAFPAASTIKVFVLQTLLEHVARGEADLDDTVPLDPGEQVSGSGVLKALTPGTPHRLRDIATLMIIVSDNTATNLLIEFLGIDAINEVCRERGWNATKLKAKLQKRKGATSFSVTSPHDLAKYFACLWRGELLPAEETEVAKTIYRRQQYTDQLGRDIGYDPYSTETGESALIIASKSGSLRGVRNDAGVIDTGERRYALAVMTKGCADLRFHPDNLGSRTIAAASKHLFDRFGRA